MDNNTSTLKEDGQKDEQGAEVLLTVKDEVRNLCEACTSHWLNVMFSFVNFRVSLYGVVMQMGWILKR